MVDTVVDTSDSPEKGEEDDVSRMVFLAELHAGETVTDAAHTACVSRKTAYRWRDNDPEFVDAWEDAIDSGTEFLELEAIRRGRDGVRKPVFHQGEICGHVQEYSDTLLIFMLKARRPQVYRERASLEHTGPNGQPLPAATTTVQAGVLVVPGVIQDPGAWSALVQGATPKDGA